MVGVQKVPVISESEMTLPLQQIRPRIAWRIDSLQFTVKEEQQRQRMPAGTAFVVAAARNR